MSAGDASRRGVLAFVDLLMVNDLINRMIKVNSAHPRLAISSRTRFSGSMVKEIERKFLVSGNEWRDLVEADICIRQFYLAAASGRSVRVRISDGASAKLTLKFGSKARERDEFEYPIPLAEAEEMLAFAIGRVIEKTRHHVRHRGHLYEVDVFGGMLSGLVVAELETPEDVPDEMLPDWLGREVTGEQRFYNASLALEGFRRSPHELSHQSAPAVDRRG
ncbi:CYTH domain-containing protein [Mesorhizobium sp. M6A.T.Ce.TU.016.01.1.1]|uniref:CYTH domain-containing protein n=1 Tax=Mesorhizobium sp. M6A.T.Ce.TU.016.01.1.1 TaxID=2496783 RepID=UPI0032AF3F44